MYVCMTVDKKHEFILIMNEFDVHPYAKIHMNTLTTKIHACIFVTPWSPNLAKHTNGILIARSSEFMKVRMITPTSSHTNGFWIASSSN